MVDYFEHDKLMQNINKPEGDKEKTNIDYEKTIAFEKNHHEFLKDAFSKLIGKN
jgi:hypothetical protein